ncbi:hypothetical protein BCR34DRAFT_634900 [Clohesyomyces aquaticus]|uniref:Uncharacterized protein n=1 Tax=Clohesyomyces aquaticus TaxID=1231657 RepID=A0A1Y1YZU2_9PLEO|nr:hypothetical protein BCR34DRAFT_634900 [Clohesyomyces aquaticus]
MASSSLQIRLTGSFNLLKTFLSLSFLVPLIQGASSTPTPTFTPPPSIILPIFHLPTSIPSAPDFSGNRTWHASILSYDSLASLTTLVLTSTYIAHISPFYHGISAKSTLAITTGAPATVTQGPGVFKQTVNFGVGGNASAQSDEVQCNLHGTTSAECETRYFGAGSVTESAATAGQTEAWNATGGSGWGWADVTVTAGVEKLGTQGVGAKPSSGGAVESVSGRGAWWWSAGIVVVGVLWGLV